LEGDVRTKRPSERVADKGLLDTFALEERAAQLRQQRAEAEWRASRAREAAERKEKAELSRIARYATRYLTAIMPDDPRDFDCRGWRYYRESDFTFRVVSAMDDDVIAGTLQKLKRELPVGAYVPRDADGSVPVRVGRCDGGIALLVGYNLEEAAE
jgi:hypothetical protein